MDTWAKRILVVAHRRSLRRTRVALLEQQGYAVDSVESDEEALIALDTRVYAHMILGRKSKLPHAGLDQLLRERHPELLILAIEGYDKDASPHTLQTPGPEQQHLLRTIREMLGRDVALTRM